MEQQKNNNNSIILSIGDIALFLLLFILLKSFINLPFILLNKTILGTDQVYPFIRLAGEIIFLFIFFKFLKNLSQDKKIPIIPWKGKISFSWIVCCLTLFLGTFILKENTIVLILNEMPVNKLIEESFKEQTSNYLILFTNAIIFAPIFEEIIFRGFILESINKKYGTVNSIIISALIFGLIHLNLPQAFIGFILGLALGWIYIQTKSTFLCILCHSFINLLGISKEYLSTIIPLGSLNITFIILATALISLSLLYINKYLLPAKDIDLST